MKKELVDYIRAGVEKGYTTASLKAILVGNGWNVGDVDEAVDIAEGRVQPSLPELQMPAPVLPLQPSSQSSVRESGERPVGITITCIFGFLLCLLMIVIGIMFLFPSSFSYVTNYFPSLSNYVDIPMVIPGMTSQFSFSLQNISTIATIVIGLIGFIGFILLFKMKKAGMFLVIIMGFASIVNSFVSFDTLKIINIAVWALIILELVVERKEFG